MRLDLHKCDSDGLFPLSIKTNVQTVQGLVIHRPGYFESLLTSPECAYALRYVELNHRKESNPWSVRQTAVYHRYKLDQRSSTWVLIATSVSAERHLDRYIKSSDSLATLNPFEIHLIILDTALANWRPYIVDLTEKITKQVCV